MKAKAILGLIVTLVIAGLLIGLVFPLGLTGMHEDVTDEATLTVSDEYNVTTDVTALVTDIDTSGTSDAVNITVNDTANDDTYVKEGLQVGDSYTLETELGDLNVTVDGIDDTANEVDVTFSHGKEYGWSDASQSLYSILGVMLIIILLVVLAGLTLSAWKQ